MIDRILPLNNSDRLVDYLARFEELMKDAEVEEEVWDKHLIPRLTGKALAAYGSDIPDNVKGQYHTLKEAFLMPWVFPGDDVPRTSYKRINQPL